MVKAKMAEFEKRISKPEAALEEIKAGKKTAEKKSAKKG